MILISRGRGWHGVFRLMWILTSHVRVSVIHVYSSQTANVLKLTYALCVCVCVCCARACVGVCWYMKPKPDSHSLWRIREKSISSFSLFIFFHLVSLSLFSLVSVYLLCRVINLRVNTNFFAQVRSSYRSSPQFTTAEKSLLSHCSGRASAREILWRSLATFHF